MTRRRESEPLESVEINLFKGDRDRLRELYPVERASHVIRRLVRAHIRKTEESRAYLDTLRNKELPNA